MRLPGLNHLLQTAKTGLPAEYGQIEETIAPAALDAITTWIREKPASRSDPSATIAAGVAVRRYQCWMPSDSGSTGCPRRSSIHRLTASRLPSPTASASASVTPPRRMSIAAGTIVRPIPT